MKTLGFEAYYTKSIEIFPGCCKDNERLSFSNMHLIDG